MNYPFCSLNVLSIICFIFFIHIFLAFIPNEGNSQSFQRFYGNTQDDSFSKVIKDGANYYVLGQNKIPGIQSFATVTRLDANGIHQWTLTLDISSIWNDAILIPGGDLIVVGSTLPFGPSTNSLMGRVTSSGGGNFSWLRRYTEPGRDFFNRIVINPVPENIAFPYYILGAQNEPGGTSTTDDVVMFNLDDDGKFNWKKIYTNPGDNEFFRDFEALPNGDLLLAGNGGIDGQIFKTDNTGNAYTSVRLAQISINDIGLESSGDFFATANGLTNSDAHIYKFDQDLLLQWDIIIPQLTTISQVWEGVPGEIFAVGRGNFGNQNRDVIIKLLADGTAIFWVKYLNAGSSFVGGSAWLMPNNEIAYSDARVIPGGLGGDCAFISVSDLDLQTACMVSEDMATLISSFHYLDSPEPPPFNFQELPTGTNLLAFSLNWLEGDVCNTDQDCIQDFNDGSSGGWISNPDGSNGPGVTISVQTPGPAGIPDKFLHGKDNCGPSFLINGSDFNFDWTTKDGECFCWDFKIFDDGNSSQVIPVFTNLSLWYSMPTQSDPSNLDPRDGVVDRAVFRTNLATSENSNWVRICAPVKTCPGGSLPSNSYGQWQLINSTGGGCNDWNNLLANVSHMTLSIDYFNACQERMGWDNFCFEPCPPPLGEPINCDSLFVTADMIPSAPDEEGCCWSIDLTNALNVSNIKKVDFRILTLGSIFNTSSTSSPFVLVPGIPPTTLMSIENPNGNIPSGSSSDIFKFCLASTTGTPNYSTQIEVTWQEDIGDGINLAVCRDTLNFDCVKDSLVDCWTLIDQKMNCENDSTYTVSIMIQNETVGETFDFVYISNITPNDIFWNPTIIPIPGGLAPSHTSGWLTFTLVVHDYCPDPFNVCFNITPINSAFDYCCSKTEKACVTLTPCCDACEKSEVLLSQLSPDKCCYDIGLKNECAGNFFTRVEAHILTPGVTFLSHFDYTSNWSTTFSNSTNLHWGYTDTCSLFPKGTFNSLFNFCLGNITSTTPVPQEIELRWYSFKTGEKKVTCIDTIRTDCHPPSDTCLIVKNDSLYCNDDGTYCYNFEVENKSVPPHTATDIILIPVTPVFPVYVPQSFPGPLISSGTQSYKTVITGNPGDEVKFYVRLLDDTDPPSGEKKWCCYQLDTICLTLPPCDSCFCAEDPVQLTHGDSTYTLICNTHGAQDVLLGCPATDVTLDGFFGCVNAGTGELCDETEVLWDLNHDGNIIDSGTTGNFPIFLLSHTEVGDPGTYCLTRKTVCPGSLDTCICKVQWVQLPCDTCCTDSIAFFNAAANVETIGTLGDCMIHFQATGLDSCMQISYDWGDDPPIIEGPYDNNNEVWHTYADSGTYSICYYIDEVDSNDSICWTYEHCEDVLILCKDTCIIPPADLVAWWPMDDQIDDPSVVDIVGSLNGVPKPNGLVGLPNGPDPVPGKVAGALHCVSVPGPSKYIEVSNDPALNFGSSDFSIDAWIYTDMGTQTQPIVDKLGPLNTGYSLSIQGTSPYYLTLVLGSGSTVHYLQGPQINVSEWNFVAVSVNNTPPKSASFYVGNNSVPKFTHIPVNFSGPTNASNSRPLLIGNNPLNPHWNIIIDELEIFNRALDSTEVAAIYRADSLGKCKDVIIGVSDLDHERKIQIFPNPTDGNFTLQFDYPIPAKSQVQIIDIEGRILKDKSLVSGHQNHNLTIADLPHGLYFVKITHDGMPVWAKKLIKL